MKDVIALIHTRKTGVNESDIKETEDKLGAVFPEQYKELFKLINNAEVGEWTLFLSKTREILKRLGMILLDKTLKSIRYV